MADDPPRTRAARATAERALIRIVHHYGARPGFVVLGGLVPELLCSSNAFKHAGTTDIDVQVDLEIACGAVNTSLLEQALRNAEFEPDRERIWRWKADGVDTGTMVTFELLADLDDAPAGANVAFDGCEYLGAANLRGTGFAALDVEIRTLRARVRRSGHQTLERIGSVPDVQRCPRWIAKRCINAVIRHRRSRSSRPLIADGGSSKCAPVAGQHRASGRLRNCRSQCLDTESNTGARRLAEEHVAIRDRLGGSAGRSGVAQQDSQS